MSDWHGGADEPFEGTITLRVMAGMAVWFVFVAWVTAPCPPFHLMGPLTYLWRVWRVPVEPCSVCNREFWMMNRF